MNHGNDLVALATTFLVLSLFAVGGALSALPEMQRIAVEAQHWMTSGEFTDMVAIAQLSPGPNMLCVVFYGYEASGLAAALLAPLGMVMPGVAVATACGRAWTTLATSAWLVWLRRGIVPVGLGLMAGGVLVVARTTITSWPLLLIAIVATVVVNKRWLHPAVTVLLAGAIGAAAQL